MLKFKIKALEHIYESFCFIPLKTGQPKYIFALAHNVKSLSLLIVSAREIVRHAKLLITLKFNLNLTRIHQRASTAQYCSSILSQYNTTSDLNPLIHSVLLKTIST